jgi:hypothetical protein
MIVAKNSFRTAKLVDHVIQDDDGLVVGTVRVKPSGIAWASAESKKWRMVPLDRFAQFVERHGKLKEK